MKKISFVADFFYSQVKGGAESDDDFLIRHYRSRGWEVEKINSHKMTRNKIEEISSNFVILGNFVRFPRHLLEEFSVRCNYIIFEHDHKYLVTRDPSNYVNFKAPESDIINKFLYQRAKVVVVFSKEHKRIINLNLGIQNIHNIGTAFWDDEQLNFLEVMTKRYRSRMNDHVVSILDSNNIIKGRDQAVEYCKRVGIEYQLVKDEKWSEFIMKLASNKHLCFLPQVFETYSKVVMEAKMIGAGVITNNTKIGALSESNAKMRGIELINDIKKRIRQALSFFEKIVEAKQAKISASDLTVILTAYRRPHLLKEQIAAIRNQSLLSSADIWIWVNDHEDNHDFDFEQFGLKVFRNNFNWKYYGRYAAAMLAETKFIAFFDDDTIPGKDWFKNCVSTLNTVGKAILGGAGVKLNYKTSYSPHVRTGWAAPSNEIQECDLIGHAWFLEKDILRAIFIEEPLTYETGEDIQLSAMAQKHLGIKTFTPAHPRNQREMWSSIKGNEYGIDDVASSNPKNHERFYKVRNEIVKHLTSNGWELVKAR